MTITREQIARLRGIGCAYVLSEQVEAILDAAEAHLSEQSRIDAAVAKERERCAEIARARANTFTAVTSGDYWNGEHFAARDIEKAIRTPTPTTEEGA